jgi:hypothetical protein
MSNPKRYIIWLVSSGLCLGTVALLAGGGCSKKADVQTQMSALEKAFPGAASPAPEQPGAGQPALDANAFVREALSAARKDDYAAGVVVLQNVAQVPGVTANQLIAAEQAKQAMVTTLLNRAAAGDANAKAALQAIEKTRSQ